jgi:hypothetical protein
VIEAAEVAAVDVVVTAEEVDPEAEVELQVATLAHLLQQLLLEFQELLQQFLTFADEFRIKKSSLSARVDNFFNLLTV